MPTKPRSAAGVNPAEVTVPPRPPGAPATGPVLALGSARPVLFDWREVSPWSGLAFDGFRLPRASRKLVYAVLKRGYEAASQEPELAKTLADYLTWHRGLLDRVATGVESAVCAPLRASWKGVTLPETDRSLFPLKNVAEALLLRAWLALHGGKPSTALGDGLAALRLTCHLAQIPDVTMQVMALGVERQALALLARLRPDRSGCRRLRRALANHAARRPGPGQVAFTAWLTARSQLAMIMKELGQTTAGAPSGSSGSHANTLEKEVVRQASKLYEEYSLLLRRGLASGNRDDWKRLDRRLGELHREIRQIRVAEGVSTRTSLHWLESRSKTKSVAWIASVVAKSFLTLVSQRSSLWRGFRRVYRANNSSLSRLRAAHCPAGAGPADAQAR